MCIQGRLPEASSDRCLVGTAGPAAVPYSEVHRLVAALGLEVHHQERGVWPGGEASYHS